VFSTGGARRLTGPAGPPFKASLLQGNVEQRLKWRAEELRPTLELYVTLTDEAAQRG